MDSSGAVSNKKKDLKLLYRHWFPSEKIDGLILDLQKPVPRQLTDINYIQSIISTYSPFVTYFVKDLLNLVDPPLPIKVCDKICQLAKLISTPEHFPADLTAKIYTVKDLNSEESLPADDTVDEIDLNINDINSKDGIWKIASNHNWRTCPIGKLPWSEEPSADIDME